MGEKDKEKKKIAWKDIGINKLLIMLAAGVLLVMLSFMDFSGSSDLEEGPGGQGLTEGAEHTEMVVTEATYEELLEERLKSVLELAKDVGRVEVMITVKASGEKIALVEQNYQSSSSKESDSQGGSRDTSEETRSELVIYKKNSDGSSVPYIVKETVPEIAGVVVIAEGGKDTLTVSNIIDAVMALFDVPIHKIKVLEMKSTS